LLDVVTLAVYTYFVACLFGRQFLLPTQYKVVDNSYGPAGDFPDTSRETDTKIAGTTNIIGYDDKMVMHILDAYSIQMLV
jgi:hypothetical protein